MGVRLLVSTAFVTPTRFCALSQQTSSQHTFNQVQKVKQPSQAYIHFCYLLYQSIYQNCQRAFSWFKQFIFVFHKCLFCPASLAGFFYQLIHDFFLLLPFGKLHIDKAIGFSSHVWLCLDVSFLGSPGFLYKPKAFGSKLSSAFSLCRLSTSLFLICFSLCRLSLCKLFPCLCLAACWPFGSRFFGSTSLCRLLHNWFFHFLNL